ncbi:hypothetical protein C9427_07740 [Mesorhizobium helmanticense]|uniref:Uncharacterized protein n=1 Tax=Mesorhizobium helmanticense TaxID=1776423 RepID=A0A2T4IZN2_9HYPH|nr:hypothetical protein C9427_07740 [Mesorhizobium helmanticense]
MAQQSRSSNASPRAVHRFTETPNRSVSLFLRNSERKTVSHFSWNCSKRAGSLDLPRFARLAAP